MCKREELIKIILSRFADLNEYPVIELNDLSITELEFLAMRDSDEPHRQ